LHGSGDELADEFVAVLLCEKMGWTYEQYMAQPLWFIKTIMLKLSIEGEYNRKQLEKNNG